MFGHGRHGPRGPWRGRVWHRGAGPGKGQRQGMRRPLRFLIAQLDLDDAQASAVSKALDDLRLEREQAGLDRRRAGSKIADLVAADTIDRAALEAAADVRVQAAQRARDAVVTAVTAVHGVLKPEQRVKLSMLLRGGPLTL
jgi:Spy/CpxP family protein refolding chaperone